MLNLPAFLPQPKQNLLQTLYTHLSAIEGVVAMVLGGSYARGTQTDSSDLDIGLYYQEDAPFAIEAIRAVANQMVEQVNGYGHATVTGFYEWGRWVNGGAWIHTPAGKVDFLYRNLQQVQRTIDEAHQGIVQHDYPQQPAYGFYSVIYLAETQVCIPLYDPTGVIRRLKEQVTHYPPLLKQRVIHDSLWSTEFSLIQTQSFATMGDVYATVGCLTRAAANLTQALFALNEVYFMSDKRAMEQVARFRLCPEQYVDHLADILGQAGKTEGELVESAQRMGELWRRVVQFAEGYQPRFSL